MKKKLYLISGFLGAGKTTLMRELTRLFTEKGGKTAVIVNEYGDEGCDGKLLSGEGIHIEEISGGSVFCVCRSDLFVDGLVRVFQTDAESVLVETSGLSDPTGIGQILRMAEKLLGGAVYEHAGTIVMVDASRFHKVVNVAAAVKQQILSAGLILINKTDLASAETIADAERAVRALNARAALRFTSYARIEPEWLGELAAAQTLIKGGIVRNTLGVCKKLFPIPRGASESALLGWLDEYAADCYRIKGFVCLDSGWKYADSAGDGVRLSDTNEPASESNIVVICGSSILIKKMSVSYDEKILPEK